MLTASWPFTISFGLVLAHTLHCGSKSILANVWPHVFSSQGGPRANTLPQAPARVSVCVR
jgi:hypothetical protein